MKVPFTSLPQHTSHASLVSAEKNHVGYSLNSPRIILICVYILSAPHMDIVIQAGFISCQGCIPENVPQIEITHIEHKSPI